MVYAEDQSNFKTRSLHHLRRSFKTVRRYTVEGSRVKGKIVKKTTALKWLRIIF